MHSNNIKLKNVNIVRKDNTIPPETSWTSINNGLGSAVISNIKAVNNEFFLLTGAGSTLLGKGNGNSFNAVTLPANSVNYDMLYDGTNYVISSGVADIFYSTNTSTWTRQKFTTVNTNAQGRGISFSPSLNRYVVVGNTDTGNVSSAIYTSDNLTSWSSRTSPFGTTEIRAVVWFNNMFVAGASNGSIATSPDGILWTLVTSGLSSSQSINKMKVLNGILYVVHVGSPSGILISTNGSTFTRINEWPPLVPIGTGATDIDYDPVKKVYIISRSGGTLPIAVTKDFVQYTHADSTLVMSSTLHIAYNGTRWITGGSNAGVVYKYDPD